MSEPSRPSPGAYVATVTPFDLHSEPIRQVRLSARQVEALDGLTVDIPLDGASQMPPCVQAEVLIAAAVAPLLAGRAVSALLWRRDRDLGDVSVWHDGAFLPIASVELAPARQAAAA